MDGVLDEALKAVFVAVSGALGTLLVALLVKLLQRVGLAISAEQQAKLEKLAQDAILAAEEWARAAAKDGTVKVGAEKLDDAVVRLMGRIPRLDCADAVAAIQHELPKLRSRGLLGA